MLTKPISGVKEQIIDMAINGSGSKDMARLLKKAQNTFSARI